MIIESTKQTVSTIIFKIYIIFILISSSGNPGIQASDIRLVSVKSPSETEFGVNKCQGFFVSSRQYSFD